MRYWDNLHVLGLSIRVGKVGTVACLQDGGAVKYGFGELYQKYENLALHWAQFAEVTAQIFYDRCRRYARWLARFLVLLRPGHTDFGTDAARAHDEYFERGQAR